MTTKYYVTDTDLSTRFPLYTRANVGEVFPDPVTPLTSDSVLWFAELGWRDAWARIGAFDLSEFPETEYAQLGVMGGYCYLNASLIRLFGERAPGLTWRDMDAQFFGAQPGIPEYVEQPGDARPELAEVIGATFGWAFAQQSVDALEGPTDHRRETKALRADRPDLAAMNPRQLWDRFLEIIPAHRKMFAEHIFTTYMASLPVSVISGVATAVGRPDLIMALIAGFGEVDSAAPSSAMWDMGRAVAASPSLTTLCNGGVDGLHDRLQAASDPDALAFKKAFDAFLVEFGSRGPNEWEMRSPTWETRPNLALAAIDRMRMAPESMDPATQNAQRADQRAKAATELLAMVEGDAAVHGQLAAAIGCSPAWLPGRERTKTNNIRLIHEFRMTLRELGRQMVAAGGFDEIEDFGFVRMDEYDELIENPRALTDRIRERRAEYRNLQSLDPSFVFNGSDPGPSSWPRRDASHAQQLKVGETVSGLVGCSGFVEGRARVVLDSNDPSALEPGDILVAPITDPSWTPLFVPAAGVIVDVGAPLSHAVIVSRELGIPCIVSVTNATRIIRDGATIRLDANTGVVTILS